ncbi:MAG: thiazole biosynthesis adenylyltransferase ThiF [Methanobacteriota archaeon]|nr:MAG: thiazole biosynthesis adenylyltransferase ThiF [Euryarchaeota archaeon]
MLAKPNEQENMLRYARQVVFPEIGERGQRALLKASVTLIGCGALGTALANLMVRAGVGRLLIADRDFVELSNLQRQTLFDETHLARNLPKAIAAAERLQAINSQVEIMPRVVDVNPDNVENLVGGADLVLDGTDNFEARYLINDACVKLGIPWVYAAVIGSSGMTATIIPGQTACLRCLFPEAPPPGSAPTCETAGILGSVVQVIASIAAVEGIKTIVGQSAALNRGLIAVDLWQHSYDVLESAGRRLDCPACALNRFEYLNAQAGSWTTSLCGRNAVQVSVPDAKALDLEKGARRLEKVGQVVFNEYLLRLEVEGYQITVMADARAIIKGTTDEAVARSLYSKYIGM